LVWVIKNILSSVFEDESTRKKENARAKERREKKEKRWNLTTIRQC